VKLKLKDEHELQVLENERFGPKSCTVSENWKIKDEMVIQL
jgi:hypothetical protein